MPSMPSRGDLEREMEDEEMKIMFDYSTATGIKECKISADSILEERQLMEVRDKIIEIVGSSTTLEVTEEGLDSGNDQNAPEEATDLFTTGGC
jgi:hypothetical protein